MGGGSTQRAKIPKSPVYADPDTSIPDDPKKIPKIGGENIVKIRWVSRKDKDFDKLGFNSKIPKVSRAMKWLENHFPSKCGRCCIDAKICSIFLGGSEFYAEYRDAFNQAFG